VRIFITVTEEPVFINPFIARVIQAVASEIVGVAIVKGSALRVRNQPRLAYLLTLALLSGPLKLLRRAASIGRFQLLDRFEFLRRRNRWSIAWVAQRHGIPVTRVANVNSPEFRDYLRDLRPDIVINQAQCILKEEFLAIPAVGSLNRHAGLLPRYRGRLAPFWAYLHGERETGVSIHFIEKEVDSGPILVQRRLPIGRFDSLDSLLEKLFRLAPEAMLEALSLIRSGVYRSQLISNDDARSSYFSSPRLADALRYRKLRLKRLLGRV